MHALVSLILLAAPQAPDTPTRPDGAWRACLDCPGGELPFGLHFATEKSEFRATVVNGAERIPVPVAKFEDGRLLLNFDYYDSKIEARFSEDGRGLTGTWSKRRGGTKRVRMPFRASRGARPRFANGSKAASVFTGRWRVQFEKDKHAAVGVFERGEGSIVRGTFLTTLGDYRYLAGNGNDRDLALSCFDGAHAFLFRANLDDKGAMAGHFWSSNTWHETWTAKRDATAALPDAWRLTKADAAHLGRLRFPDLAGQTRTLTDPAFAGKARILFVFGSWCPNCKDASSYLAELHRRYEKRGLSVVGLAFEHSGDSARDTKQLKIYAKRQGIDYPILLAGLSDKKKASQALPLLDRVRSYPTTIFLRGDGRVHSVYTGFSGPGTGPEYARLQKRFEAIVQELLQ